MKITLAEYKKDFYVCHRTGNTIGSGDTSYHAPLALIWKPPATGRPYHAIYSFLPLLEIAGLKCPAILSKATSPMMVFLIDDFHFTPSPITAINFVTSTNFPFSDITILLSYFGASLQEAPPVLHEFQFRL